MMEIQHFSHLHPLKLGFVKADAEPSSEKEEEEEEEDACKGCKKLISGKSYGCQPCGYYLHESCANLPQEIQHFFHSCPLFFKVMDRGGARCVCRQECDDGDWVYHCEECNYTMHVGCAQFSPIGPGEEGILHFSHHHPLMMLTDEEAVRCKGCKKLIVSRKSYGCRSCGYYLHDYCASLRREIQHFFHRCPLYLKFVVRWDRCGACRQWCSDTLVYRCRKCDFIMHVACTEFSPIGSDEEGIMHFTHHHPLKLTYGYEEAGERETPEPDCDGCMKPIAGKKYACHLCGYYLHDSCGNLPGEIKHFFHPGCTLSLQINCNHRVGCDGCLRECWKGTLVYRCQKCDFTMHGECARFADIDSDHHQGNKIQHQQHLSHRHPLKLFEETGSGGQDSPECILCSRKITGQAYGACEACRFYIHKSCMDLPGRIRHRCHPCPLFLRLVKLFHCNICLRESKLPLAYECSSCEFKMDAECAHFSSAMIKDDRAEHILHFCHQHPLQLFEGLIKRNTKDKILRRKLECLVCRGLSSGLTYGCKECDVFLHKPCLDVFPQTLSIRNEPSVLVRLASGKQCAKCSKSFSGFYFICRPRDDYYCVPCALLEALSVRVDPSSVSIEHPYHPCSVILKSFATFNCNACFRHCSTHAYYCGQCDFYLGLDCKRSATSFKGGDKWIEHFCHLHPLQPSEDVDVVSTAICRICGILVRRSSYSSNPSYSCSRCDFHAHKSCLDILCPKIDHHYFRCTLVLLTTPSFKCILCQKEIASGLAFRSIEQGFKLCMECYFWPKSKLNDDGTFSSIHHWHQLSLTDNSEKYAYQCLLCGGGYSSAGVMYYHCKHCQGYFHKDCAELPFEMRHPLHPQHSLTLIRTSQVPKSRRNCSLCLREFPLGDTPQSGIYHCKECSFQLDRKCASTCIPSIKYQGHSAHLLTVVEHMYGQEDCQVCSASCKSSTYVFRCIECKFSLHLSCGPLPCDIKHPCHVHPLVLEDFYVEENYTDKFPCHVCENERDPMLPVYRCVEGCPMVCEIQCAISEVMPTLLGHHGGDVALRTTFPNVESKVIPGGEISKHTIDVSTTRRARHINLAYGEALGYAFVRRKFAYLEMGSTTKAWEREMLESHDKELEQADDQNEGGDEKTNYSFSKEAFTRFSTSFGCTPVTVKRDGLPEFISQHNGPAAGEEHFLSRTLVPIHQEFIAKHDELDIACNLRYQESKSYFVSILCAVLHNMRRTKVVELTSERVRQWLSLLKLVELAGFDVSFAVGKMKRVWEAHFLTKAKAIADETSNRLSTRRQELSRREEELVRELEATRREMEEVEERERHHHKYLGTGMKSLRKEYRDSLLIKWKPCTTDII